MKRLLLLSVLLLFSNIGIGKNQISIVDSLKSVLAQPLPDTSRINTILALARELKDNDISTAFKYASDAYQSSIDINYPDGMARASSILGVFYLNFGDTRKALLYHFKALEFYEKTNNSKRIAYSFNNIGAVFSRIKNYERAKLYYRKSLEVKLQNGLQKEASSSYINLGNIAMYQHDNDSCIYYYKQGLSNAMRFKDDPNVLIGMMNLGEAYFDKKEMLRSLNYYNNALKRLQLKTNKTAEAQSYFALGKIYDQLKQYRLSEESFTRALELNKVNNNKELELRIYKYMSQMLEHRGDLAEALSFNKKFIALNDSLYSAEIAQNINESQTLFDLKEKEEQIKLLNKENELNLTTKKKDDQLKNFLIISLVLISIIALLLTRSIVRKQKTNKLLNLKTKQIESQQKEIETKNEILAAYNKELLKENAVARYETLKSKINPHFLFNSLSTLSALIIKDSKSALEFVSKFSKLYRSIMEHGHENLVTISSELEVLNSFVYLKKMRFGEAIQLSIDIPESHQSEMIPPFALQLLVENAIKHNLVSNSSPLYIHIKYTNNLIKVTNNIHPRNSPAPGSGIGQQSIIERYQFVSTIPPQFYKEEETYIAIIPTLSSIPQDK